MENDHAFRRFDDHPDFITKLNITVMKFKHALCLYFSVFTIMLFGCQETDLSSREESPIEELASARTSVEEIPDSARLAERSLKNTRGRLNRVNVVPTAVQSGNYALTATVSATSTFPGYSVQNIVDGDQSTALDPQASWANDHFPLLGIRLPASVIFRFPSPTAIDRIDIYTSLGYEIQDYTISCRTASLQRIQLVSVTGNTSAYISHAVSFVPDATVLEIKCTKGPARQVVYARLNEVEIYGPLFVLDR
jgi:hypothetical protein